MIDLGNFVLFYNHRNPTKTVRRLKRCGFGTFTVEELREKARALRSRGINIPKGRRAVIGWLNSVIREGQ